MGNEIVRQSNIELCRSLSMFMILMLHANFVALGVPDNNELKLSLGNVACRYFWEALSVSSVNVFVLISGWFGIRPSIKGSLKLIYQIIFFLGLGYLITLAFGITKYSLSAIADIIQISSTDWFIKSYFVIMILSPILNCFVTLDERTQSLVLFFFLFFEIVFGWIGGGNRFFVSGFGPLHLLGIYLIGQYLHYTYPKLKKRSILKIFSLKPIYDLIIFFLLSLITALFGLVIFLLIGRPLTTYTLAYSSPFVIGGGIFFFLCFSKLKFPYSRIVNWLGAGSFSVYLFHGEYTIRHSVFIPIIRKLYFNYSGFLLLVYICLFLIVIYLIACLIDQLRHRTWNLIYSKL